MPPLAARPRGFMAVARSTPPSSSLCCRGLRRERHDAVLPGAGGGAAARKVRIAWARQRRGRRRLASSVAPEAGWHEGGAVWNPARRVRAAGERRRGPCDLGQGSRPNRTWI